MRTTVFLTTASALALGLFLTAETARADDNRMFMEQIGDRNFAFGNESAGSDNSTWVQQSGDLNSAGAGLADANAGAIANKNNSVIYQSGNRNVGSWAFNNNNENILRNKLGIAQDGNRNYANFILTDQGPLTDSTLFVYQEGTENFAGPEATPSAGNQFNFYDAGNSGAPGYTLTPRNPGVTDVDRFGPTTAFGVGVGTFNGDNQYLALHQDGIGNAFAVGMTGSDNTVTGSSSAVGGLDDFTETDFYGNDDVAIGNMATQVGNDNVGVVLVEGIGNTLSFNQNGNNNVAESYQSGSFNSASINQ